MKLRLRRDLSLVSDRAVRSRRNQDPARQHVLVRTRSRSSARGLKLVSASSSAQLGELASSQLRRPSISSMMWRHARCRSSSERRGPSSASAAVLVRRRRAEDAARVALEGGEVGDDLGQLPRGGAARGGSARPKAGRLKGFTPASGAMLSQAITLRGTRSTSPGARACAPRRGGAAGRNARRCSAATDPAATRRCWRPRGRRCARLCGRRRRRSACRRGRG